MTGQAPKMKSYAVCSIFNAQNQRAALRLRTVEVASRNVLDPAIPHETYCVRFFDRQDDVTVNGRKGTFAAENESGNIFIARNIITREDMWHLAGEGKLESAWLKVGMMPDVALLIRDRQDRLHAVKHEDVVFDERGCKRFPSAPSVWVPEA